MSKYYPPKPDSQIKEELSFKWEAIRRAKAKDATLLEEPDYVFISCLESRIRDGRLQVTSKEEDRIHNIFLDIANKESSYANTSKLRRK